MAEKLKAIGIAAGVAHSLALLSDGTVRAWGYNSNGQCGIPRDLYGVKSIAAGYSFSAALRENGTIAIWGEMKTKKVFPIPPMHMDSLSMIINRDDMKNWLQIIDLAWRPSPSTDVKAIAAGFFHLAVLLGNGTVMQRAGEPKVIGGISGVRSISAGGYCTAAVLDNGSSAIWGDWIQENVYSEITGYADGGHPFTGYFIEHRRVPVCQPSEKPYATAAIAPGPKHAVVLTPGGSVMAWGNNSFGQCRLPATRGRIASIAAGYDFTVLLDKAGKVSHFGRKPCHGTLYPPCVSDINDAFNYLGMSTETLKKNSKKLVGHPIPKLHNAVSIAAGYRHALALKADGTVAAWGNNEYGQCNVPDELK